MKISKSLIQAIAIAVTVSTVVASCTKEKTPDPEGTENQKKQDGFSCPGCGLG
jgi:hypothetical protein